MQVPRFSFRARFGHVIWGGFLAVLAVLVVQGGMSAWSLSRIEDRSDEAIENVSHLVGDVREIQDESSAAAAEVLSLSNDVRTGLSAEMNDGAQNLAVLQRAVERLVASAGESLKELEAALDDESLDENAAGIIEDLLFSVEDNEDMARKECLPTVRSVVDSLGKGIQAADETAARIQALEAAMNRFAETSREVADKGDAAEKVTAAGLAEAKHAKGLITAALVTGIIVGSFIPFLIVRRTTGPLRLLIASIRDIAEGEGDLTKRLRMSRGDEIGELAGWFDTFVERVHGIISEVAGTSGEVAAASTQIAASSEQMSAGLSDQTRQVEQISSAIEEMSSSIMEVARSASDAANDADSAGRFATDGGKLVADTVEGMGEISMAVGCGANSVTELGHKSEQIGSIIEVINDIADQTNLLALNAAIEAARAGEHGRGFAVVADEVRKLAERTSEATKEVSRSIGEIQSETAKAVELIGSGAARVGDGVALANKAGEALTQIVTSSQSLAQRVASIATATDEQSGVSEEIARGVDRISTVTRQSSEGAGQAAIAAGTLSREAEKLRALIGQFKL
ncbi:MAG: methyl-accepting chemotaxis protein [Phycisphaeraceae bacterium]|nr:MAG: methyl-accepting chemotaxis protein [Phycisphaeraceae bacterium]